MARVPVVLEQRRDGSSQFVARYVLLLPEGKHDGGAHV